MACSLKLCKAAQTYVCHWCILRDNLIYEWIQLVERCSEHCYDNNAERSSHS